ncbi:MAG TPA: hypothetical protein VFC93_11875 [Chloroflexota bacterium]|nr:hypothetical protein [Chloroflexota bacterium]
MEAPGAELWTRVTGLPSEVAVLRSGKGPAFSIVSVDERAVYVAVGPERVRRRIPRRALEAAAVFLAAGQPVPPGTVSQPARVRAILRAVGVA